MNEAYFEGKPLAVGVQPVLLCDDLAVEDRWGVRRVINRPIKDPRNPVLMPDMPWEDSIAQPNVIYDPQASLFRMWYTVMDRNAWLHQFIMKDWSAKKHGYPYYICYAQSADGVHFDRPLLDGRPYMQHARTNVIVTGSQKAQAVRVRWTPPAMNRPERFMMTCKDNRPTGNGAFVISYSDDGINWREDERGVAFTGARDTWQDLIYDETRSRWLLFTRPVTFAGVADVPGGPDERNYKRRTAVMVGPTPYDLGSPRVVMSPTEIDEPDFDHITVSRCGSHFVGMVGQMGPRPQMAFSLHLAFSDDGLRWQQLPERQCWLPHGGPDQFDSNTTSSASHIVDAGDCQYVYYVGARKGQSQGNRNNQTGIGRAMFQRDRFVAQFGAHTGGFLLTREMIAGGPRLFVNITTADGTHGEPADATISPEFAAEIVQAPGGQALPGYSFADCTTKAVDMLDLPVTWNGNADLSELVGQPVFIRFYLKNCGLYALRFGAQP